MAPPCPGPTRSPGRGSGPGLACAIPNMQSRASVSRPKRRRTLRPPVWVVDFAITTTLGGLLHVQPTCRHQCPGRVQLPSDYAAGQRFVIRSFVDIGGRALLMTYSVVVMGFVMLNAAPSTPKSLVVYVPRASVWKVGVDEDPPLMTSRYAVLGSRPLRLNFTRKLSPGASVMVTATEGDLQPSRASWSLTGMPRRAEQPAQSSPFASCDPSISPFAVWGRTHAPVRQHSVE